MGKSGSVRRKESGEQFSVLLWGFIKAKLWPSGKRRIEILSTSKLF